MDGGTMEIMAHGTMEMLEVLKDWMNSGSKAVILTIEINLISKLNILTCHHGTKKMMNLLLIHILMLKEVVILMDISAKFKIK